MDAHGYLGFVAILMLGTIYFFPVFLASSRNHPNTGAIFALTLLLGWTFVGWVLAIIWAMTTPIREHVAAIKQANEPAMYNETSSADVQLRNLDREFRARRIGIDEYRQMKKVLTGE